MATINLPFEFDHLLIISRSMSNLWPCYMCVVYLLFVQINILETPKSFAGQMAVKFPLKLFGFNKIKRKTKLSFYVII